MRNKAPIFINGFQRGGTNILMNLIASHPDVCMLGGETQVVFYGRNREPVKKWFNRLLAIPIFVSAGQHSFWPYVLEKRKPLPRAVAKYVDYLLYVSKVNAPRNLIRDEVNKNSRQDIKASRLLAKNINGVSLAASIFADMYPDATFFGLVRNGLALCEGFVRRGWTAERFGKMYQTICQKMLLDAENMKNYHLVYFEDLIDDPIKCTQTIYAHSGLDISQAPKFRLQAKKTTGADGSRNYTFGGGVDREINWFSPDELPLFFKKDVNQNQIARLAEKDKDTFLKFAEPSMRQLGYL